MVERAEDAPEHGSATERRSLRDGLAPVVQAVQAVRQHALAPGHPLVRHVPPPELQPPGAAGSVVDWALYVEGQRHEVESYTEAVEHARRGTGFVWIGLFEPTTEQLTALGRDFGLHPLAVEDAVVAHQRPKLDRYDDALFMVLKTVRYVPHEKVTEGGQIVETGEVMVFVGQHYVVTVRHGEHGELHAVRQRLEGTPELLARGPSTVLYGVADAVVDGYVEVTDHLQDDVDEMETLVFSETRNTDIGRIYQLKRELMELRRAVTPLVVPLGVLVQRTNPVVDKQVRKYLRDVEDHLTRVAEQVASYDELLAAVVQASLAKLSIAENEDMRKLAAWAAIIAVPTAIAGIYGMNFRHMPELDWQYGYAGVLLLIAVSCLVLFRAFKRSGWL